VAALLGVAVWVLNREINITVRNSGARAMNNVTVELGCESNKLGDIPAGSSAAGAAYPTCESSATVFYRDDNGEPRSVELDVYIESRNSGSLHAEVRDGTLVRRIDNIYSW